MRPKGKNIIWNCDIAYVIGLITTDGSLSNDGRHIDFTSNDTQLIKTFKNCLKIKNRIAAKISGYTRKKSSFRIQFGNIILYRWLVNIGLMPNKTKKLTTLKIPDRYFFHFLRGHLDGDGCIRRFQDPIYPNSQRLYILFNSASLVHLKWIQTTAKRLININGFFRKSESMHILTYAKKESLALLLKLYPNSKAPCLKRKYKIIHDLVKMPR